MSADGLTTRLDLPGSERRTELPPVRLTPIAALETADVTIEHESAPDYPLAKFRRLRRDRKLVLLKYWTVWAVGGLLLILLLAGGIAGLSTGG